MNDARAPSPDQHQLPPEQDMPQDIAVEYTARLRSHMQSAGLESYRALSHKAEVSERQILRLRRGEAEQMRLENLSRLAQALQRPVFQLMQEFTSLPLSDSKTTVDAPPISASPASLESALRQEYERLQTQLQQQKADLTIEFQREALYTLETWMTLWPTVVTKVQEDAEIPASRVVPLIRPIEKLLAQWGVEAIATVGAELPYDPTQHQLMGGAAEPGQLVRVRNVGYYHRGKLLHRAKVSPV